jgi:hypothetical protein
MAEDCQKKAADLGFDLTKQFLTLAFGGIAFIVGLSFNTPGAISSFMLWGVVGTFAVSAALGLCFLMHGVSLLHVHNSYDIYASSLRILAVAQIVLVLLGVGLLVPVLSARSAKKPRLSGNSIEIRADPNQSVIYPIDPEKSITIELEAGKIKVTTKR